MRKIKIRQRLKYIFGSRRDIHLGVALIVAFLLPHGTTFFMLFNPLLCLSLMSFTRMRLNLSNVLPIFCIVLSLALNIVADIGVKSMLAAGSLVLCLIAFPLDVKVRLKNVYIYLCLFIIFMSQLGYLFHWNFIANIIDQYYNTTQWHTQYLEHINQTASLENYLTFRFGGLYVNSNQCSKYLTFLLALYLVCNKEQSFKQQFPYVILFYIPIVLTGSRTGWVVGSALLFCAYYLNPLSNVRTKRLLLCLLPLLVVMVLMKLQGDDNEFRGAKVAEGFQEGGSINIKFSVFLYYLAGEDSFFRLLFGHFDETLFKSPYEEFSFDSDYGCIIYSYGFFGFIALMFFIYTVYMKVSKYERIIFITILWMTSSTIITSYRNAFVFFLILSIVLFNNRYDKRLSHIKPKAYE